VTKNMSGRGGSLSCGEGGSPFRSHAAHGGLVKDASLAMAPAVGWSDRGSRSRHLRGQQRIRVARRAACILQHYKAMQQEATAGALIHARRLVGRTDRGLRTLSYISAWCRSNTVGAHGLDIPGFQYSAPGQFMHRMAEARGGMVTGPFWGSLKLPERHQEVIARKRLLRGICKRPRETGDVDDAPTTLQTGKSGA
jgi:hypothetical protein